MPALQIFLCICRDLEENPKCPEFRILAEEFEKMAVEVDVWSSMLKLLLLEQVEEDGCMVGIVATLMKP